MSRVPEPGLYTPIADELPPLYRRDPRSWDQLTAYLDLVDGSWRAYLNQLIELPVAISPLLNAVTPPGSAPDADRDTRDRRHDRGFAEVARWLGFAFPADPRWTLESAVPGADAAADAARLERNRHRLERKSAVLVRAPRLWRRRTTPGGFLAWLCCWFDLPTDDAERCPVLIEHHAYASREPAAEAFHVTLLVPQGDRFRTYAEVVELAGWLEIHVPAHLVIHHYLVPAEAWRGLRDEVLPAADDLDALLAAVRARVPAAGAIRSDGGGEPQTTLGLDVGRLVDLSPPPSDPNRSDA